MVNKEIDEGVIEPNSKRCTYIVDVEYNKNNIEVPIYCGKQTKYRIVLDEDENKTRDYDHLCQEHRAKVGSNYWVKK